MIPYLLAFVLSMWPRLASHATAVLEDIDSTDASPLEALTLANIAAFESGFNQLARGVHGERGAFQVMPPAPSYGAAEALRRLRIQGILGYVGCADKPSAPLCLALVAHRTGPAILWRLAFDPPALDKRTADR